MKIHKLIAESFSTQRLIIEDAKSSDVDTLQQICDSWTDKVVVEGSPFEPDYIATCLTDGDLPPAPQASRENYRLKVVRLKEDQTKGAIMGFFDLYYGYPTHDTIYLSIFLIHANHRKNGYAHEVVEHLIFEGLKSSYSRMMLGVAMKNWPAVKFWTGAGFDKVVGIFGDAQYAPDHYAILGLEKSLKLEV